MKFGRVPLAEARGAILAHSLRLPDGRLRKGIVLEDAHLAAIAETGQDGVTVARLGPQDLHEDIAARAVAETLVHEAEVLRLTEAFTGRVNVIAEGPGVAVLDVAAIHAANAIDPAITVATVDPFRQMRAGGMVATVKITAYGVHDGSVTEVHAAARGALSLARPVHRTASLVVTDRPGGPGRKGVEAIAERLAALGMTLAETLPVAHEPVALARCLRAATGEVLLVLTASATSDPGDTGPAALRLAGGRLERFGMPVDPGNLLFLGDLDGRPVIGLPNSARSPVLHGADWVLSRVVCGIPVRSADIAAMGVGGLLKEIPTRPHPRRGRRPDPD